MSKCLILLLSVRWQLEQRIRPLTLVMSLREIQSLTEPQLRFKMNARLRKRQRQILRLPNNNISVTHLSSSMLTCPTFTPKPHSQVQLSPAPPKTSDIKMTDDFDKAEFKLPSTGNSATENDLVDSATEDDSIVESAYLQN